MNFHKLTLALIAAMTLTLGACQKQTSPDAASTTRPADPLQAVASEGKGFTVGAMMSANTVYVMFDPQCPHCGHLWQASLPLHPKLKFVWVPVSLMGGKSATQGAALLMSTNPLEAMTAHEASLLANTGGIDVPASVPADVEQAILKNTRLFNRMAVESVPYIIARNASTGQVVTHKGAYGTAELAEFLGVDKP